MINSRDYDHLDLSVAMTEELDSGLRIHLDKGPLQEDLTFAVWRPSRGLKRFTAVLQRAILPGDGDRILNGNVMFTPEYVQRVLYEAEGGGIAFLHSHVGPGWQGMSRDDVIAEKLRLASAVAGRTGLPLVGLTRGTDGSWSARFWLRTGPGQYDLYWAKTVRVVGRHLKVTYHPELMPAPRPMDSQVATVSVWGEQKQADLARVHVGIVGMGSVGSIVAEALSRIGTTHITEIDYDTVELRNLDRTLGTNPQDAKEAIPKVLVSKRLLGISHTAAEFQVDAHIGSLLEREGLQKALDCDVLFSCVDRPWPRHVLNAIAYAHLIPVIDGGILAKVNHGRLAHVDWRIHTIGPGFPCMACLGALRDEDVALDMAGLLDDPSYVEGLGPEFIPTLARQNVFPFSLSVAAHEVLQFIALATGQARIGGSGAQMYHAYPGIMELVETPRCEADCQYASLTASATDLTGNIKD